MQNLGGIQAVRSKLLQSFKDGKSVAQQRFKRVRPVIDNNPGYFLPESGKGWKQAEVALAQNHQLP